MSLSNFLKPTAVALIGASFDPTKIGHQILKNIVSSKFPGKIYPVNLKGGKLLSLQVYKDLAEIPRLKKTHTLVVVAIPAALVLLEIEKAGRLGFKNLVIISAGFKESGADGQKREELLKLLAKKYDLNILGPNCLGFINNNLPLNLSFAQALPLNQGKKTGLAFLSQSGALGSAVLDWCRAKDLNFELFVSLGNQAVCSENDFLELILTDSNIKAVHVYLEEIAAGERFVSLLSRLAQKKPVFVLMSGLTDLGARAAKSHTGSLLGSALVVSLALKRSGAVVLKNLSDFFNSLELWSGRQEQFKSLPDLFIISNAGGPAVLSADAAAHLGVNLPSLSPGLKQIIKKQIPALININNPLDILGDADPKRYELALKSILQNSKSAQILILLTAQTMTDPMSVAKTIVGLSKKYPQHSLAVSFIGGIAVQAAKDYLSHHRVSVFDHPESFLQAYRGLYSYINTRQDLKVYSVPRVVNKKPLQTSTGFYDYIKSLNLLRAYKIPTIKTIKYTDWRPGAVKFPAVVKVAGPDFIHKSDQQALALNLSDNKELKVAASRLSRSFKKQLRSPLNYLVVQESGQNHQELILGFKRDINFGSVLMIGQGGIYAEIFKDLAFSLADLDLKKAIQLIKSLKIYPILNGVRGQRAYDLKALAQALSNLSRLALEHPEIQELDINPLFVKPKGAVAVDVRIIV